LHNAKFFIPKNREATEQRTHPAAVRSLHTQQKHTKWALDLTNCNWRNDLLCLSCAMADTVAEFNKIQSKISTTLQFR